jgi:hypothetical protein
LKKVLISIAFFTFLGFFTKIYAACNHLSYIPANYNIVSCSDSIDDYIFAYIVSDNNKLGAYTKWDDPLENSTYPFDASRLYNKIKVPLEFDNITVVKNGFIVEKNSKFGFFHIDKGKILDTKYDKLYLSDDGETIYAIENNDTTIKKNPQNKIRQVENMAFNIFVKPFFFRLDDVLSDK